MTNETKQILIKSYTNTLGDDINELKRSLKELSEILLSNNEKVYYSGTVDNKEFVEAWELDIGSEILIFNRQEVGSIGDYIKEGGNIRKVVVSRKDLDNLPEKNI